MYLRMWIQVDYNWIELGRGLGHMMFVMIGDLCLREENGVYQACALNHIGVLIV